MPIVSVILPVYNQEKFIAQTIESVLCQTFADFELLIWNDGSTDSSASIIEAYAARDKRIIAFSDKNVGRSKATNALVSKSQGEWCAFLDADDLMLPNRLERQIAFHKSYPDLVASSCNCYYINNTGNILGEQRHPFLRTPEEGQDAFKSESFVQCAITGLFISKNVFINSGGLNSKYWPCDDFEFFNRLIEQKYFLLNAQETLMKYRIHSSSITVQKPLHTYDVIGYVMDCIKLRRSGQSEITFEEFMATRSKDSWWVKMHRRRFNYSQIFFRNAGVSMMSKKYSLFCWQIFKASLLSPKYVLLKAVTLLRKTKVSPLT